MKIYTMELANINQIAYTPYTRDYYLRLGYTISKTTEKPAIEVMGDIENNLLNVNIGDYNWINYQVGVETSSLSIDVANLKSQVATLNMEMITVNYQLANLNAEVNTLNYEMELIKSESPFFNPTCFDATASPGKNSIVFSIPTNGRFYKAWIDNYELPIPSPTITNGYTATLPNGNYKVCVIGDISFNSSTVDMSNVVISKTLTTYQSMFQNCLGLTYIQTIPNSYAGTCDYMFSGCANLTKVDRFPNNLTSCIRTFFGCSKFNSPLNINMGVNSCMEMLSGCTSFNSSINIANTVKTCSNMFFNCINFNQPITLPSNSSTLTTMFGGCINFNQPITINNVADMQNILYGCNKFNSPITFINAPANNNLSNILYDAWAFNQVLTLPNGIITLENAFNKCYALNKTFNLPESVRILDSAFALCSGLKMAFTIPTAATTVNRMHYQNTALTTLPPRNVNYFTNKPPTLTTTTGCYGNCPSITTPLSYATIVANYPTWV